MYRSGPVRCRPRRCIWLLLLVMRGTPAGRELLRGQIAETRMRAHGVVQHGLRTPTELRFGSCCIDGMLERGRSAAPGERWSGDRAWHIAARCSRGCAEPDAPTIAARRAAPCAANDGAGPCQRSWPAWNLVRPAVTSFFLGPLSLSELIIGFRSTLFRCDAAVQGAAVFLRKSELWDAGPFASPPCRFSSVGTPRPFRTFQIRRRYFGG